MIAAGNNFTNRRKTLINHLIETKITDTDRGKYTGEVGYNTLTLSGSKVL